MPNRKQGGRAPASVISSSISRSCWPMPAARTAMTVPRPSTNSRSWMVPSSSWKVHAAMQILSIRCGFHRPMRRNSLPYWNLPLPPAGGNVWLDNSPRHRDLKFLNAGAGPGKHSVAIWPRRRCGGTPSPPSPGMVWRVMPNYWPSFLFCSHGSRKARNRSCGLRAVFSRANRNAWVETAVEKCGGWRSNSAAPGGSKCVSG